MKTSTILSLLFLFVIIGCGQSTNKESQETDAAAPGPVTQSDKNRYNLGTNEELVYGSMDSVMRDSLKADSLNNQ